MISIKPACPWAAYLAQEIGKKISSYVEDVKNNKQEFHQTLATLLQRNFFLNLLRCNALAMIIWKPFYKHDVQCLKSIRRIVVPLRNTNLPASWEEALHEWNFRVQHWSRAGNVSVTDKGKLQYYRTSGRKKN